MSLWLISKYGYQSKLEKVKAARRSLADVDQYGSDVSTEQITAEYKSRVLTCHPDKHQNDESAHGKFSKLSRAKDTLLDPEKRKDYDKWRNSGIAMPFERWQSLAHITTSMHWGYCKEQVAIGHQDNTESPQRRSASPSYSLVEQDKNFEDLKEKLKFIPREKSKTSGRSPEIDWERDTSNPLRQKFRNYEI